MWHHNTNTTKTGDRIYEQLLIVTHWGRDKMADIFQKTFSNAFCWMKMSEFRLIFHWSLFLRFKLTIFHHWFRSVNLPSLVQIMAWCLVSTKPLSEPMMVSLLIQVCGAQPRWFNCTHCLPKHSLKLDDVHRNQWSQSSLLQVMACFLFGTKSLPEPMLTYWQLGPKKHISVKNKKMHLKMLAVKCRPFYAGLYEFNIYYYIRGDCVYRHHNVIWIWEICTCVSTCISMQFLWNIHIHTQSWLPVKSAVMGIGAL